MIATQSSKGKDTVMKNSGVLRLVWENINGDVCEHEMPMLDWVLDWWGACAMVPGERARIGDKPPMTRILKTVWRRYAGCKIAI